MDDEQQALTARLRALFDEGLEHALGQAKDTHKAIACWQSCLQLWEQAEPEWRNAEGLAAALNAQYDNHALAWRVRGQSTHEGHGVGCLHTVRRQLLKTLAEVNSSRSLAG